MWFERKHGLSTEPVPVSGYAGSWEILKDLKDRDILSSCLTFRVTISFLFFNDFDHVLKQTLFSCQSGHLTHNANPLSRCDVGARAGRPRDNDGPIRRLFGPGNGAQTGLIRNRLPL